MSNKNEGSKLIIDYLVKANRPYSANDICTNLNGQLGKTAIVNTLEKLAADKKILEKVYCKQKVYMALQSVDVASSKTELRQLDEKIATTNGDLNRLKAENTKMEAELSASSEKMPIGELEARLKELKEEINEMSSKVSNFKSGNVKVITKDEKNKAQKELDKLVGSWRKYKRIANEIVGAILENCNMKKSEFIEEVEIITDEQENVKMP